MKYGLRSLIALISLLCISLAGYTRHLELQQQRRATIDILEDSLFDVIHIGGVPYSVQFKAFSPAIDSFEYYHVTDCKLAWLKRHLDFTPIRHLKLDGRITDHALRQIHGLKQLQSLRVGPWSRVTRVGIDSLRGALPHCEIFVHPSATNEARQRSASGK